MVLGSGDLSVWIDRTDPDYVVITHEGYPHGFVRITSENISIYDMGGSCNLIRWGGRLSN
jgi:hypothetical protein